MPLQWRPNGCDGVSDDQSHDCLLNHLFRRRSTNTSKFRVTGLCVGNSPVTSEFPTQKASNAEIFPFDDVTMNWKYWWLGATLCDKQWLLQQRCYMFLGGFFQLQCKPTWILQLRVGIQLPAVTTIFDEIDLCIQKQKRETHIVSKTPDVIKWYNRFGCHYGDLLKSCTVKEYVTK